MITLGTHGDNTYTHQSRKTTCRNPIVTHGDPGDSWWHGWLMMTVYVLTNPGRQQPEISWLLKVTWWLMVTIIHVLTSPGRQQSEISRLLMLTLVTCGEQAGRQSQAAIWNPLVTHAVPCNSWWPWWLVVTKTHVLTGPRWQSQAAV